MSDNVVVLKRKRSELPPASFLVADSIDESLASLSLANAPVPGVDIPRVKRSRVFRLGRRALPSMSAVSSSSSPSPSMALDESAAGSADVDSSLSVEQVALPSSLDGVWGMFELRRRPTVLMNGVPLVRETVDPDSEFVFDVYYRSTAAVNDDDRGRMPEVVFDSDLGRANGGAGALALTAAAHAHIDDNEDLDAVEHEYPGPSDEERDDDDERRHGGGARHRRRNDNEAHRAAPADDNSSDDERRRAGGAGADDDDDEDDDDDLFTSNAADVISDVVEREFYFGDYGRDDDFDPDDANF